MAFISLGTHFHERQHKYYHVSITLYMTVTYQSIRTSQSETHRNYLSILKYLNTGDLNLYLIDAALWQQWEGRL